jgi:hypothetical protein
VSKRRYTPNVQQASIDGLVKANKSRRLDKYPEDVYGEVGTKERRKATQKCVQLRYNYNITYQCYLNMLEAQNHKCALCGEEETGVHNRGSTTIPMQLCVDHCHDTGAVRGLLCTKCNKALGLFKDNPELLEKAAKYIRLHSGG